jgi:carboxylate-amine ligase
MGDEQKLTPDEMLTHSREQFEAAQDFTLAVEEEFALLDPETHNLVNRFEDLKAAAAGTELDPHLVGELIASEAEVKTGRCDTFAQASDAMGERREQLAALAGSLGLELSSVGTHPWADWKDQRIIDTPHYRRNDELLRYVVWRNNTFGLHAHIAVNGPDRAIRTASAMRNFLPELLALSASSPFVEGVCTYLHSARTQIFTGSVTEHTQVWWSVRAHLAFPTVEVRIMDGQPDLGEARSLVALAYALVARIARALDEGEPLPDHPNRLLEENLWRAIRYGLSGELIDLDRGEPLPARARIEQLIEWTLPVANELGVTSFLGVPARNAAERQLARFEQGASLEQIYAEELGERVG